MPLDHYVSQVHINNFSAPELNGRVYAVRKSDLKRFEPRSQDVCRIEDNSSNAYLKEDRLIEEFLKDVEPRYNASIAKLRGGKLDPEAIYAIAGFVAYVMTCAPAGMRIHAAPLKVAVEATAMMLDAKGEMPKAPEELGHKSLTELVTSGDVHVKIDEKYPQAMGISSIIHFVSVFGNSSWEILINSDDENPFLTSDYPVAIDVVDPERFTLPINRIVPLAPDLALKIVPDIALRGKEPDLTFAKLRFRRRRPSRQEVLQVNRLVVQCAEDTVMSSRDFPWLEQVVRKYKSLRIEAVTPKFKSGDGFFLPATLRIRSAAA
jgi:hypothetical protein